MNANFFAMGQAQVAEAVAEKPSLYQGASAGSLKRTATMAMIGTLAAVSFGMAPGEASAQLTPQQFRQELDRRQQQHDQQMERNRQQAEFNRQNNRENFEFNRQYRRDAQKEQSKQMVTGLVTSAVVGGVVASIVGAVQGAQQQPRTVQVQQSLAMPRQQFYGQSPQSQPFYGQQSQPAYVVPSHQTYESQPRQSQGYQHAQQQPVFYLPRDLGMPDRFTKVSQRSGIGMAAPGQEPMDLRDRTQTSHNMVRALDALQSAVEQSQRAQEQLDNMRLSNYQVSGQQQQQVNSAMQATNNLLDRAIETYMRMSNNAALEGKNTQGFNALAAKMINENLAPEQRVNMNVNARPQYGYGN